METSPAVCPPGLWDGAPKAGFCPGLVELQALSSAPKPGTVGVKVGSWEVKEWL